MLIGSLPFAPTGVDDDGVVGAIVGWATVHYA
jgi:hypothetical protein